MKKATGLRCWIGLALIGSALVNFLTCGSALANSQVELSASATLREDLSPLDEGLIWRIYSTKVDTRGLLPVLHETRDPVIKVLIKPGTYVLSAAYGRAVVSRRVEVGEDNLHISIDLNAGAIRLIGKVGTDRDIAASNIVFNLYPVEDDLPIIERALAGVYWRVPAGDYRVVSTYGNTNAEIEAEVRVEAGKLSVAEVFHRAAMVALKLVRAPGGKAQANTSWDLFTADGERLRQIDASVVRLILQEGEYTVIAKHEGEDYRRNFVVENGIDRDVEVLLSP